MEITGLIVELKPKKTDNINNKEDRWDNGIVDAELGKRTWQNPKEAELRPVYNVAGDVECHDEATQWHPYDEETPKIDFSDVFGVQK